MTLRGSEGADHARVTGGPHDSRPWWGIRWAATHADGLITVAGALKDRLVALGTPAERVSVLRNGVDLV